MQYKRKKNLEKDHPRNFNIQLKIKERREIIRKS